MGQDRKSRKKGEFFRPGYAYVICKVGPTRFEDECAVYIERLGGGTMVALADPKEVEASGPIKEITEGKALVRVVRRIQGGFVIDPPGESLNSAGRVHVPESAVRFL